MRSTTATFVAYTSSVGYAATFPSRGRLDFLPICTRTETIFPANRYVCNGPMKGIGPYETSISFSF